jgi:hypothetical protein
VAEDADDRTTITPIFVEVALGAAFPGARIDKGTGIGRKVTFNAEFGEFHLSVYTPEEEGMKGKTTYVFRRTVNKRVVSNIRSTHEYDDTEGLAQAIKHARAIVMGIYVALQSVLETPAPERADLLGDL